MNYMKLTKAQLVEKVQQLEAKERTCSHRCFACEDLTRQKIEAEWSMALNPISFGSIAETTY